MPRVIFISSRPMPRCENITAVYKAFKGDKKFDLMWDRTSDILHDPNSEYDLVITDELVRESKAPVMMIYHGAALGKTYLMQRHDSWEMDVLKKCSKLVKYAISSSNSPEAIASIAEECGINEEQVYPYGMPRMDKYIKWPHKTWFTSYLYAPTFRTYENKDIPDIDLDKIDRLLSNDEILFIKPHMILNNPEIKQYKHIVYFSKDDPSEKLIAECDVLITDYSSIMFDAFAFNKPVVLFEKDHESYLKKPGMCLPYPDGYSSRHCRTEEELVNLCRDAAKNGLGDNEKKCKELSVNMCDGHATERVVQLINDILEEKR